MMLWFLVASVAALNIAVICAAGFLGTCPIETLVNTTLYGFLSLLAVVVLQRERHFRGIFYQMWFLFTSFSVIIALRIFSTFLSDPILKADIYVYSTMLLPLLVCWTVVYVLYAYIFFNRSRPWRLTLTLMTVLPIWLIAFYPFYINPSALALLQKAGSPHLYYHPLYERAVFVNLLSLSAVATFFLTKLRSDRPFGVYIDTMMFWFSLFVTFEILYDFSRVTNFSIFTMSQYAATGTLLMITGTFILRMRFLSRTAGVLYESQIVSTEPFIGRRAGFFDRFIRGNFFNSEAIAKRLYLETPPRGRISPRFSPGAPWGAISETRSGQEQEEKREE